MIDLRSDTVSCFKALFGGAHGLRAVMHLDVSEADVDQAAAVIEDVLKRVPV